MGSIAKIRRTATKLTVASGGTIDVESGATLNIKSGATVSGITGVPTRGEDGQFLKMGSEGPEWAAAPTELPATGTTGYYLKKTESGVEYAAAPQGVAVADAAGDAPTAAEFKALLDSLRDAGIIAIAAQ